MLKAAILIDRIYCAFLIADTVTGKFECQKGNGEPFPGDLSLIDSLDSLARESRRTANEIVVEVGRGGRINDRYSG